MKILVCCGNGLGSSFMIEMNIKKALQEIGAEAEVSHCDLASAGGREGGYLRGNARYRHAAHRSRRRGRFPQ